MYLTYGTFAFNTGETLVSFFGQARRYNQRGWAQSKVLRMVVEGEIVASGQAAINTRMAAIQDALAVEGYTVAFRFDSGAETRYKLDGPSSRGVRILELAFQQQEGKAHFATGLPFTITFEAEYGISDLDPYVSFQETVGRIGNGGPRVVWQELDYGEPVPQTVSTNTTVTIVQQGTAVGASGWPPFPRPLWEPIDNPEESVFSDSPELDGLAYVNWPIRWSYRTTLNYHPGIIRPRVV
jgi:hypothetical protein